MTVAPLKRSMFAPSDARGPTIGKDVQIAKFGISRYEDGLLPKPKEGFTQTFGQAMEEAVRVIQHAEHIPATGNIGASTWDVIWPLLDRYRRWQYRNWTIPRTFEERAWERLIGSMIELDTYETGYQLGSGHGQALAGLSAHRTWDCSSSCSKVLYEAGLFEGREYAIVSGDFWEWGEPGEGSWFTVYYSPEHVWIRLYKGRAWRFDTSPHGDGGRGPQLRYTPRFTTSFRTRHYPSM